MKVLSLVIIIISLFSSIFSAIDIQTKREIFADNIQSFIQDTKPPEKWNDYVYNVKAGASIIIYGIEFDQVSKVKNKFDLTEEMMTQIKAAKFCSSPNSYSKLENRKAYGTSSYQFDLGAAFREDEMIYFALIRAQAECSTKTKYEIVKVEKCHRVLFWNSCHYEDVYVPRSYTGEEIRIVQTYLDYRSLQTIKSYLPRLREGNYQLIMSHGHSIYSEDGKSVAYFTDFGALAIGPTSKLPVYSKPFKYYKYWDKEKAELVTKIAGSDHRIDCYITDVKTKEKKCFTYLKGLYWKFNFVGRTISDYQRSIDRFELIERYRNNGKYLLELKSNGNMVITNTLNNQITWQSYTANKGKGPYNLEITNNKTLVLFDSEDKIIYSSKPYVNVASVDYKVHQNGWYRGLNGEICGNTFTSVAIDAISVSAYKYYNDTSLSVKYTVYNSQGATSKADGVRASISQTINGKEITQSIDYLEMHFTRETGYNLCYSVFVRDEGWTDYACNGAYVGRQGYSNTFYKNLMGLMVFIVPKNEVLNRFSTIPAFKIGN